MTQSTNDTLIDIQNLKMYFPVTRGLLRRKVADVKAVDDITFKVKRGETMGLVGESGCGKTTTGRCVLRLYKPTSGHIIFEGHDISQLPESKIRPMRRRMSLIFQDPFGSLNPRMTVGGIVGEPLKVHRVCAGRRDRRQRVRQLLQRVGLEAGHATRYPHEFSGGQRQRIGIARALALNPSFIVCDEPISALDVSIQAQVVNLLEDLQEELGLTYLFIAHDLSMVQHISHRIAVMYLGKIVELTACDTLFEDPLHPYTRALLDSVPKFTVEGELKSIEGNVPNLVTPPTGCRFHPRCPHVMEICPKEEPGMIELEADHFAACHLYPD